MTEKVEENSTTTSQPVSDSTETPTSQDDPERKNLKVNFSHVDIYYFERTQGFLTIPSDTDKTSITLGMAASHQTKIHFDNINDYLLHQRREHLNKLEIIESKNPDEKIADILRNRSVYEEDLELNLEVSTDLFCPILTPSERREKLDETEIDESETKEIFEIKESRESCGCKCKDANMICGENGDFCSCYANGIPCQLDRVRHPCGCSTKRCKNPYGLKKFDYIAVLKHYMSIFVNRDSQEAETAAATVEPKNKRKKRKRKPWTSARPKAKIQKLDGLMREEHLVEDELEPPGLGEPVLDVATIG